MSKTRWADVSKGDHVELNGKSWLVERAKSKGKTVKVTVRSGSHTASSEVRAKDRVKRVPAPDPLRSRVGRGNAQRRWATPDEARGKGLEPGVASVTKRPEKPSGDAWNEPRDKAERKLDTILGAHLVGEATDVSKGYYVPPVDVTTIASHMALFHPNMYDFEKDEATMLAGHEHAHKMAHEGTIRLDVNHWHTKTRPDA